MPPYRADKREQARRLYLEGMTLTEVGEVLGVSKQRVAQYLQELGVRRRSRGRPYRNG